ncbi:KV320 protein, partial [Ptilonorhynchus violaceus]|nr:KV320 protein [Ptilonorhynchus violaceus]
MWSALCVGFLPIVAVTGQVVLEQGPRELSVREGDGVTFQCRPSRYSMWKYHMYWYRQGPSGSLILVYMEGEVFGEGFKDRFKGSLESYSFTL